MQTKKAHFSLKLWHRGLILVLLPVLFEAGFLFALAQLLNQAENDIRRQYHAQLVTAQVGNLNKLCYDLASELAASAMGKAQFDEGHYNEIVNQIKTVAAALRQTPSADRIEAESLRKVAILADEELQFAVHAKIKLANQNDGLLMINDQELRTIGTAISRQLIAELKQLEQYESAIKRKSSDVRQNVWTWLLGGLSLNVAAAAFLTVYFSKQFVQRIGIIAENSRRMAESKQLAPALSGADEIAEVDHAFHDMASKLDAANQAKQQFVEMITHDLRSPLNAIRIVLDLFNMGMLGELSEEAKKMVGKSLASCDRLLGLINNLLDIDKLEAGSMDMALSRIELDEVLKRGVEAVERLAENSNVKLELEETEEMIYGDKHRLIQVVVNLISNAIKFSPKNGIIKVSVRNAADNFVEVSVSDCGRGIPENMHESIFHRFQQVQASDATVKGGSGLGLAICKAIVDAHHGKIGVKSSPGAGSTFWFRIPADAGTYERST
jgi:signal transduction histidine kinase